jgi:hypothetical protein
MTNLSDYLPCLPLAYTAESTFYPWGEIFLSKPLVHMNIIFCCNTPSTQHNLPYCLVPSLQLSTMPIRRFQQHVTMMCCGGELGPIQADKIILLAGEP